MTRSDRREKSTSMQSPSRLWSSITLNSRMLRPSASWSCMKSIDQTWLIAVGTSKGRGFSHQALARLDPQIQFELAVNPVDAFVVPLEALHVAQIEETQTEAPVALVV